MLSLLSALSPLFAKGLSLSWAALSLQWQVKRGVLKHTLQEVGRAPPYAA